MKGCRTLRQDVRSRATLHSLANSPYRDVLAAVATACGSIILVKGTELLHAQGWIDKACASHQEGSVVYNWLLLQAHVRSHQSGTSAASLNT